MDKQKQHFNNWRKEQRKQFIKQGLCSNGCGRKLILKWFCRECADKINQYARNCRNNKIEIYRERAKIRNWKNRFGGMRAKVIERDKHSCQICGYYHKIRIHHIDENNKNNSLDNLIVLCIICHAVIERINKNKPNLHKLFPWFK